MPMVVFSSTQCFIPALLALLVCAPLPEDAADSKGHQERLSSSQLLKHNKVSQVHIRDSEVLSVIFRLASGRVLQPPRSVANGSAQACAIRDKPAS